MNERNADPAVEEAWLRFLRAILEPEHLPQSETEARGTSTRQEVETDHAGALLQTLLDHTTCE